MSYLSYDKNFNCTNAVFFVCVVVVVARNAVPQSKTNKQTGMEMYGKRATH